MNNELIKELEAIIQWTESKVDGLKIPKNHRERVAASLFDMAMEHQKSIVLLCSKKLYGSALALVRCVFETHIKGRWLYHCASNDEIKAFESGKMKKNFGELIEDIEKNPGHEAKTLSSVKRQSWRLMNDFTHSGFNQIVNRMSEDAIEANYDEEQVTQALNFAMSMGLMSSLELSLMADDNALSLELLEKMKQFAGEE